MKIQRAEYKSLVNGTKKRLIRFRKLLSILLSFLLSIVFVGLAGLITLSYSSFNEKAVQDILLSSDYYHNVSLEIESDSNMLTLPTGLPLEVVKGVFSEDEVRQDVDSYMEAAVLGEAYQPELEEFQNRLRHNIGIYLAGEEIVPDQQQSADIDEYIETISKEYAEAIKLPLLEYWIQLIQEYQIIHFLGVIICVSIILLLLILLYKLNPWFHRFLYYVYNGTMAAGLMLAILPILTLSHGLSAGIQVMPASFNHFAIEYMTRCLRTLLGISILFIVLSFAILLSERIIKSNLIKIYKLSKG
jgi:hypothetical protein